MDDSISIFARATEARAGHWHRTLLFWRDQGLPIMTSVALTRATAASPGLRASSRTASAVMMAVDEKKRILLVRQYRLPAGKMLWELPAGKVDEGETPLQAAKRELIEETGYRARKWEKLSSFYPSPGFVAEKMTIYLATELTAGKATPMDDERIETKWYTKKELQEMIRSGKIEDAKTLIGFHTWNSR